VLQTIIKDRKIPIAFHSVRVVKPKLSLIYIQGLLLIDGGLNKERIINKLIFSFKQVHTAMQDAALPQVKRMHKNQPYAGSASL